MPCRELSTQLAAPGPLLQEPRVGTAEARWGKAALDLRSHKRPVDPEPKLFSTVWETAWSPGKGTQPASGALMGIQALPLVGWVARVAETPPGSASPSRLSNIFWCLPSRLTVGLGLSILEINTWGHLTGLYRIGAEIQVKMGQIQSPPLSLCLTLPLPAPHQGTSTSQQTGELPGHSRRFRGPAGGCMLQEAGPAQHE